MWSVNVIRCDFSLVVSFFLSSNVLNFHSIVLKYLERHLQFAIGEPTGLVALRMIKSSKIKINLWILKIELK